MIIFLFSQVRQSPTNVFLASLATADLLLIFVCLPLKVFYFNMQHLCRELYETNFQMAKLFSFSWQFGWVLCKLAHYSETLSVVCSVLNLTALSVERWEQLFCFNSTPLSPFVPLFLILIPDVRFTPD